MRMGPITEPHPSSSDSNFAFTAHSPDTLPRNLPPSIDNALLARRRRRRTSPHDQAILEEEYLKCNRPDRTRRREICQRVDMGEKEVQIWFCNKRQAQRRRATPLLPHEMIPHSSRLSVASSSLGAYGRSSSPPGSVGLGLASHSVSSAHGGSSSPTSHPAPRPSHRSDVHEQDEHDNNNEVTRLEIEPSQYQNPPHPPSSPVHIPPSSQFHVPPKQESKQPPLPNVNTVTTLKINAPPQNSEMTTSAHRRLQDVLTRSDPFVEDTSAEKIAPPPLKTLSRRTNPSNSNSAFPVPTPRLLKKSSSVRLSTSLEGKATVILEDEPPSSPPMLRTPARPTQAKQQQSTTRRRPLGPVDSKLWELCCDNQSVIRSPARTPPQPLEATQALRLIRSKSFGSASRHSSPMSSLRREQSTNSLLPPPLPISKKLKSEKKTRKVITANGKSSQPKMINCKGKEFTIFEPSLDSDKENRPPGAPISPPSEPKRCVIGVSGISTTVPSSPIKPKHVLGKSHSTNVGITLDREESLNASQESGYVGGSQDSIGTFMAGGSQSGNSSQESLYPGANKDFGRNSPRRIDEMECIENLLSLRGGTWR